MLLCLYVWWRRWRHQLMTSVFLLTPLWSPTSQCWTFFLVFSHRFQLWLQSQSFLFWFSGWNFVSSCSWTIYYSIEHFFSSDIKQLRPNSYPIKSKLCIKQNFLSNFLCFFYFIWTIIFISYILHFYHQYLFIHQCDVFPSSFRLNFMPNIYFHLLLCFLTVTSQWKTFYLTFEL